MATYKVRFYDFDPNGFIPTGTGSTFTWTGPADADGKATIFDTETGTEGVTLDDDSAGGETATADVDLNGTTSTGSNVDAERAWTVEDTVTGDIFQIVEFDVENGSAAGDYTLSEIPLVANRSYEVLAYDSNPDVTAGDIAFDSTDYVAPPHVVTGTSGADDIDASYTGDPQNDQVDDGYAGGADGNDNDIEGLGGNDTIDGGLGDDTIDGGTGRDSIDGGVGDDLVFGRGGRDTISGGDGDDDLRSNGGADEVDGDAGDDTIDGGGGNDSLTGGDGNDSIEGGNGADTILGNDSSPPVSLREGLDWSLEGSDGTSVAAGFTQDTGSMDVTVSFTDDGNNNPTFLIESTDTQYTETGEEFDPNSALYLYGNGDDATSTTTIDFAAGTGSQMQDEVENVTFRINDIDAFSGNHEDVVTVNAFDAGGSAVTVTLTPEGDDTTSGNTITAGSALDDPDDANGSVLVEIDGPVAQIEIIYTNGDNGTQAIHVTDIFFDTIVATSGIDDDVLDGEGGTDSIDGGLGDDTITGGAGDDTMTGGAGDDVFVLADGSDDDTITDFDTDDDDGDGFFNDQLDVTNLTDAGGNPVDAWDVVVSDDGSGNALLSFPNGESVVLQGVAPSEVTGAQLLNSAGIPCFTPGTLIATPRGEVPIEALKTGDRVTTRDGPPQEILWLGERSLGPPDLLAAPHLKPILIPQGAVGNHTPLLVSPQHGMLFGPDHGLDGERFVRAKHLAEAPGPVRIAHGKRRVRYIHLMCARHQVIYANGAPTESFYPGPQTLRMFSGETLMELRRLIPSLGSGPVAETYGPPARPYLTRREAMQVLDLRCALAAARQAA
ncbi:MAG: Hint domain-containing protein [Rhodobacter sp.]|nr:Hint domain-containing protein [Rhodobacter sp.]